MNGKQIQKIAVVHELLAGFEDQGWRTALSHLRSGSLATKTDRFVFSSKAQLAITSYMIE